MNPQDQYESTILVATPLFPTGPATGSHVTPKTFVDGNDRLLVVVFTRQAGWTSLMVYTRFSSDKRPFKTHVGIRFSHASGKDAHAPVFYLHLEPEHCFAAAGVWHPAARALTKIRMAIAAAPEQRAKVRRKLELEGDSLKRPPRGFDPNHRFIADIKR